MGEEIFLVTNIFQVSLCSAEQEVHTALVSKFCASCAIDTKNIFLVAFMYVPFVVIGKMMWLHVTMRPTLTFVFDHQMFCHFYNNGPTIRFRHLLVIAGIC